jgi:hypothetical protein
VSDMITASKKSNASSLPLHLCQQSDCHGQRR